MSTLVQDMLDCPVCLSLFDNPLMLKCGHTICSECIKNMNQDRNIVCPTCRKVSNEDELVKNYVVSCLIDAIKSKNLSTVKAESEVLNNDNKTEKHTFNIKKHAPLPLHIHHATICEKCPQIIQPDEDVARFFGKNYHKNCFTCKKCNIEFISGQFYSKDGDIYCKICYHDCFSPKCTICKHAIMENVTIQSDNNYFHEKCFKCEACHQSISKRSFYLKDDCYYCKGCYEVLFSMKCFSCNKPITGSYISSNGRSWHNYCLRCEKCYRPLSNDEAYSSECSTCATLRT